jgi:hypothetical protein
MRKQLANPLKQKSKGQSLVELTLILTVLLTLMIGMMEFSNLLNEYISVVDGAREGARLGSYTDPEISPGFVSTNFCKFVYWTVQGKYNEVTGVQESLGALNPIILNPATDDIIVSVFSIRSNFPAGEVTPTRFICPANTLPGAPAGARYGNKTSSITNDQIKNRMIYDAPSSGLVLVEVYYAYHQLTGLLDFVRSTEEPIMVHTYSIMPLSAAEPTPTNVPPPPPP